MYLCHLCLIILLWKLSESDFRFHCPVQSHRKHIAEHRCGSMDSYFCLFNRNEHYFTQFCRKQSDFEAPGHKLIVAGSSNGTLQGADCNSEFYQPFKFLSSGSSRCVYEKSYCSGEGQVVYRNGTLENDRSCRCDYTRGYDFVNKPRHRCYCVPSEEDCSCHLKLCQSNYILSPDYECLNENEWKPSFHCDAISPVVLPKDPKIPYWTDNSSLKADAIANGKSAGVAVLVVFMLMLSVPPKVDETIASLIAMDKLKLEDDKGEVPNHVSGKICLHQIDQQGLVKSACAYHIAFRLKNEFGYTIVPAQQPSDITHYYIPGTHQVFIIDDFIGKYEFDEAEAVSWEKEGPLIHKILSNNDQTKVVLTCRKSIWHPDIFDRFGLQAFVCDLDTDKLRLTLLEKRTICEAYLEKVT
ncbi:unnamed protein product [Mytilus edulis]|uniref:Novel STAND NTPase 3 domain-containing protein n=1 Tax=Mytilus edulis TaxID=6550 RepID=A0A8S3VG31_MYTED|nr:unnamed protein product [Mytilus edulis]